MNVLALSLAAFCCAQAGDVVRKSWFAGCQRHRNAVLCLVRLIPTRSTICPVPFLFSRGVDLSYILCAKTLRLRLSRRAIIARVWHCCFLFLFRGGSRLCSRQGVLASRSKPDFVAKAMPLCPEFEGAGGLSIHMKTVILFAIERYF